jgi:hypothetical protein
MNKRRVLMTIAGVSFAAMMVGCSKAPEQELSAAKAMLDSARVVEADKYMTTFYSAAQDSLKEAIAEIEKQNGAPPIVRSFDRAKALLISTSALAQNARMKAQEEKQRIQAEVDTMLKEVPGMVAETRALLSQAPKGKDGKAALDAIGTEISAVESSLSDAQSMRVGGDLIGARSSINAGIAKLGAIKTELAETIAKAPPVSKKK